MTLKTLGVWFRDSGRVQALLQTDIAPPGIADLFLHATHVAHTRRAHQVTVAALNTVKDRAYDHYCMVYSEDEQDLLEFQE